MVRGWVRIGAIALAVSLSARAAGTEAGASASMAPDTSPPAEEAGAVQNQQEPPAGEPSNAEDGKFDMSRWLLERKGGFLLVPIIITEPAVGNGGGAAAAWFHTPEQSDESKARGERLPPDIYGVMAFKTANGSRGAAVGGSFHFKDDTWRYLGGLAKVSLNLDFYTGGSPGEPHKIGYNLDGVASLQQVSWRLGHSKAYVSARWVYMDIDSTLDVESDRQYFQPKDFAQRASGLGASIEYDSRDNTLSPSSGWLSKAIATFYGAGIGSDNTFQTYRAHSFAYEPFAERWVFAGRIDWRSARGDVPFYQLPSIDLRGIAYGRFQNENVAMIEAELRWRAAPRWTLLGFGGAGRDWGRRTGFSDAPSETTRGVGFRYTIARKLGLDVGVDLAWGPDDRAYYLQVGSAWR